MTWMSYETGQPTPWHAPSQDAVAKRFAEAQAERLRFCHDAQAWFVWDGVAWRRDRLGVVIHRIRDFARECVADPDGVASATAGSTRFIAGIERFARGDPALAVTAQAFDVDPFLLGTPDGAVALATGTCVAADPADGISLTTRVTPAEGAACPLWRQVLDETFGGDTETIGFVQRLFGSALTADGSERAIVVCLGASRLVLDTVAEVMGDYASQSSLATLTSLDALHGTERASLRGARLVVATDGDDVQAGRRLEQLAGEAAVGRTPLRPGCMLLVACTVPPRLADAGVRGRVQILPFAQEATPPGRDRAAGPRAAGLRAAELRAAELRAAELRAAELRAAELRAAELRAAELRAAELRAAELRAAELRAAELRAAELRAAELRAAELRAAELRAAELRAAELRAEGPAILRWLIEGCLDGQADGLGQPPAIEAATQDYLEAEDAIRHFLAERCVIDPARTTTAAALFAAWSAWAEAAGEETGSRRAFVDAMSARRFRRARSETARFYVGIGLTPPDASDA